MKKALPIILALLIALANIACAETVDVSAMTDEELKALSARIESELTRRENERSTTTVTEDDGEIIYVNDGKSLPKVIFASEEQLKSRLHKIELTPESWNQYLGDYYYPFEDVVTNNFGEVTQTYDRRAVGFGFKEGYVGHFREAAVKFSGVSRYEMQGQMNEEGDHWMFVEDKWKESDEVYTTDINGPCKENCHLEQYECIAVTGYIFVLEVAPEITHYLWQSPYNWIEIYVGDERYSGSDSLWRTYEKLNP